MTTKNDAAWRQIFEKLDISSRLSNGEVIFISAKEVNQHGGREARLMAKHDNEQKQPKSFR
jgi:hypothetical protein